MPTIEINDLASIGAVRDVAGHLLPPEAWTLAENVEFREGNVRKMNGTLQVFGTPGGAPHFGMEISSIAANWWLYASLTRAYVYDGTTHTDITRASGGNYAASATRNWNGTILGGIPIFNNGVDVPQYWASYAAATKLQALSNWTATHRAKVIRALGPHLIAGNITKSGVVYAHMIKTSHPAVPGALPASWDNTDATKDATENDLSDTQSGIIQDLQPLRGQMFIYKENAVWRMRYIGGRQIWAYESFLESFGAMTGRSVGILGDGFRHLVVGSDDVIVHDGQRVESVLDRKWRRELFNDIDPTNFENLFVFCRPDAKQMWICYPEDGAVDPTKALVWDYGAGGSCSISDVNFRNTAIGVVQTSDTLTWEGDDLTWEADDSQWSKNSRRKTVLLNTGQSKFLATEEGNLRDGVAFDAVLQRVGISVIGRKRNGEWIVDFERRKFCKRVWIKAKGDPFFVRLGSQDTVDGEVTWAPAQIFDPLIDMYLDFNIAGRALAIEFSSDGDVEWEIAGYKLDIELAGNF